jgi:hypothetical protein
VTRAALARGVVALLALGSVGRARAQDRPTAEAADRACATYVVRAVRALARTPKNGDAQGRAIFRAIARGSACPAWSDELRDAARAAAARPYPRDRQALEAYLANEPLRAPCTTAEGGMWDGALECRPAHPLVSTLRTTAGFERTWSNRRRFVVLAIDRLTAASHRLVAAAQILWTFANWDWGCVPSVVFLEMEEDLRDRYVRLDAYGRDHEEARRVAPGVAERPAFRRARRCS